MVVDVQVGDPGRRETAVVDRRGAVLGVLAVAGQVQADLELVDAPDRAQQQLGIRQAVLEVALALAVVTAVRAQGLLGGVGGVDGIDRGGVPVEAQGVAQVAVGTDVLPVVADQVDAAGGGVEGVGEVGHRLVGRQPGRREDRLDLRGAAQVAGLGDAVLDLDLVGIQGDAGVVDRLQGQAEADVGRLLRFQGGGAEGLGHRRIHRDIAVVEQVAVDAGLRGRAVDLLRQRRRAEAGAEGAAHGEDRGQLVTGGELAVGGGARTVVVVLIAPGQVHVPFVGQVLADLAIAGHAGAAFLRGVGRSGAGTGNGSRRNRRAAGTGAEVAEGIGVIVALADLVALEALFQAPGNLRRLGQAEVEGAGQVEVVGPLAEGLGAGVDRGRRVRAEAQVIGVAQGGLGMILAVGAGQVVVPAGGLALAAEGHLEVVFDKPQGVFDALRERRGDPVEARRLVEGQGFFRVAPGVGGERVQGQGVIHRQLGVVAETEVARLGQAGAVVGVALAGVAGAVGVGRIVGAVGGVLLLHVQGQVDKAVVGQ